MAKKWIKAEKEQQEDTGKADAKAPPAMLPRGMDHKKTMKKMYRGEK